MALGGPSTSCTDHGRWGRREESPALAATRVQRAEIAELVVLLVRLAFGVRLAEQGPQREMDRLARVGQMEPTYRLLDQIVVEFDLDPLLHWPTIPSAHRLNRATSRGRQALVWSSVRGPAVLPPTARGSRFRCG